MVSIVTKKIKGNEYLYLVDSIRKGPKVIQKTIKYIGRKRPVPKEEFECMKYSYKNKDWILEKHSDYLNYKQYAELKELSDQYKEYLKSLDKISRGKEREKFLSLFISNSNGIEGSTLTAKDTFNLLFKDISPGGHPKKEIHMALNLLEAWNYLEKNYKRLPNEKDLLKLHSLVNKEVETEETLGKYKKVQNYVGDSITTSFLFVEEKMKKLMNWVKNSFKKINDFEVAFQSHAQFEIIHPFVDGNGRVGRLLLNWLLMYKNISPLAIGVKHREEYISALVNSQRGKVEAICKFCYEEYKQQYKFV